MARKLISVPSKNAGSRGASFRKSSSGTSVRAGAVAGKKVGPSHCPAKRAAFRTGY